MPFRIFIAFIVLHICFCQKMLFAQTDSARTPANNVYVEFGGKAQLYSINYERKVYSINSVKGALAVGGAYQAALGAWYTGLEHNVFIGKNIHNLELGAGYNYLFYTDPNNASEKSYVNGRIGYRFQPLKKGIMVRMGYTPLFRKNQNVLHWVGLSFGYSF